MVRLGAKVNLLICQKSKIQDWVEHFKNNYPMTLPQDCSKKFKWNLFEKLVKDAETHAFPHIYVINYELAWRRPELLKLKDFTLMLDESSLIQNKTAKQSRFILKLNPTNVILLSGTPTSGKYENLWTQAKLLGWEITDKTYQDTFVNWKLQKIGYMNPKIFKVVDKVNPYKNVERLKNKLREHGAIFMKTEECFELPEQTFVEVNVSKHRKYNEFMKNSFVEIDDVELVGDTSLTKRLYARMLCGQYCKEKVQSFRELLESTNDRLIVFYNFNLELEELTKVCEALNRPISLVNGSEKDLTAYENESDSVTLVQYQAGAMGLNLQKANRVIYFTLPERSELFEQSKKRIHRIGQENKCFYYVMMCEGTIERDIYEALKQRKDYTDELFRESTKFA